MIIIKKEERMIIMEEEDKMKDKDPERGTWSNPCDFFISCLGYAVGLGNIWRFPYLCYKHGGGSFLIPYFIMLFLAGLPVFLLEISLGQYAGVGPIKIFGQIAPITRGLGFAVVIVGLFLAFYYNVVVSWSIWYLVSSLGTSLEWERCGHWYNTDQCWSHQDSQHCQDQGLVLYNNTCHQLDHVCAQFSLSGINREAELCGNSSYQVELDHLIPRSSSSSEYYERYVLGNRGHDWFNFGSVRLQSVVCLAAAWALVTACLIKGVKTSGKVAYFTSLFPYLVLVILAGRGFSLPGAGEGISYYLHTDWNKLRDTRVWVDAATQVIFSLGPACGCVITLSSYNSFTRNCLQDAVIIAISNSITSMFSGLVVFSILGFMAHVTDKEVSQVVSPGPGLAFIVYPEVVSRIPGSQFWAILFFLMLISLALGSIFGAFETVITAVCDQMPVLRDSKPQIVITTSLAMFLLGLPFCCNGGIHMFTLFDASAPSWNLLLFALLEVIVVSWMYGVDRFLDNLAEMEIKMTKWTRTYWRLSWRFSTPAILTLLLIFSWHDFGQVGYKGEPYPVGIQILGYLITGCTLIALPVGCFSEVYRLYTDSDQTLRSLVSPTQHWGPNHYQSH